MLLKKFRGALSGSFRKGEKIMSNHRGGFWYWICLVQPQFLFLAWSGLLGEDVRKEADAAAEDLGGAIVILLAILVVGGILSLIGWLIYNAL
ncbi:MAG: hypothetical protein A2Z24_01645 [Candidatus Woykebacteria bacterium RBG_16_44_10]|uniref:Uncharacterized protein n=1 Tax=Candidatus Woykebacteria bacterium RBG_16_44_10 TaxID=1802597 RepID=A0A1G1WEW4_9BACT|nr:MAG: hypothetical protein A2Z24_01645 [Candidatus Woykebacteria bacterium RBG_16_44_10]